MTLTRIKLLQLYFVHGYNAILCFLVPVNSFNSKPFPQDSLTENCIKCTPTSANAAGLALLLS